ncbi:hypothetical protein ACFL1E_06455 [Candidatus Omnitrophota bacterium]
MKKHSITITVVLIALMTYGMFLAKAEAASKASIGVSCRIPSLLQMDARENSIEAARAEIKNTSKKMCVQEEGVDTPYKTAGYHVMAQSAKDDAVTLYSFYER